MARSVDIIASVEDFHRRESEALFNRFSLDLRDIVPYYFQSLFEKKSRQTDKVDPTDPNISFELYQIHMKKLASCAIIYYELTVREAMKFPLADALVIGAEQGLEVAIKTKDVSRVYKNPKNYEVAATNSLIYINMIDKKVNKAIVADKF